jgi:ABC-type uncharacterized transport system permease subunit
VEAIGLLRPPSQKGDRKLNGMSLSTALLDGFAALALLAYLMAAWRTHKARRVLPLAWLAQALALCVDLAGVGQSQWGGRFGFAPALSLTHWLVVAVVLVESAGRLWPLAVRVLALSGAAAVFLAWLYPGQTVVAHHALAPLHWALGLASYGLVGTAVLHAWMMRRAERSLRDPGRGALAEGWPLMRLERLTFRFLGAGVGVLSLTLLLGASVSSPWRWDHKTVFALLAWTVLTGLLAARHWLGWRGGQAARWLYAGAALLLLSYAGSRFVLEVMLGRPA